MESSEDAKFRQMTETPVSRLVIKLALPTTVSMLITTIYNTADTYFVSRISVSASGATGIVFSLMAILQAFGFMYGHGAGSNISRLLGARNTERASIFSSTSFFLAAGTGAIIALFGLIFLEPFMYLLGSTDTILADAKAYATFILIAAPGMTIGCVLNNILRYEGLAAYAMVGLTSGGILNMILDPIFIFSFGMGTAGAGLATAISQYVSVVILILPFLRGKTVTRIVPKYFTRCFADVSNIVLTGMPSMFRQGLNSICSATLNLQASAFGDAAIAAFSIVNRVCNLLFSLAVGLGQGFQPVSAFNFGAKKYSRVRKAFGFTIVIGFAVLSILCSLCFINAESVVALFRGDEDVLSIGGEALRYMCIGLMFLPVSGIGSMLFQSTGSKGRAMIVAALQTGVIYLPLLLILPGFLGLKGLQFAHPIAYVTAALISAPLLLVYLRQMKGRDGQEL